MCEQKESQLQVLQLCGVMVGTANGVVDFANSNLDGSGMDQKSWRTVVSKAHGFAGSKNSGREFPIQEVEFLSLLLLLLLHPYLVSLIWVRRLEKQEEEEQIVES
jgi:hypothetical protein